ncbi:MAG: D-alanine--D-alanine ligase [Dehalococcoidia bacterium]|nr:D-alanine--D-alanine ligase [Dehalococcoidia bacterium]
MRIGLSYDLKESVSVSDGQPQDALEEYDSPETVDALEAALGSLGHQVIRLKGGRDFLDGILREPVDFVFNISEGLGNHRSREAQVPSVLEMLGIPYAGSDPQCLAICLDKPLTKSLVAAAGVSTPPWKVFTNRDQLRRISWDGIAFPVFIKPAYEGSSKGISGGCRKDNVSEAVECITRLLALYRQPVIVEEYVGGDEVTVGLVGNSPVRVIGVMRITPKARASDFVYSLEVKRNWRNLVEYECPAAFEDGIADRIVKSSVRIFDLLGCRDFARIDFRLDAGGAPNFLEINPLPGLNPTESDLSIMSSRLGILYPELVSSILNAAVERYGRCVRR